MVHHRVERLARPAVTAHRGALTKQALLADTGPKDVRVTTTEAASATRATRGHGGPPALARPLRALPGRHADRPRLDDRQRRPAVDPGRPRVLRGVAGLGGERLSAHLRRLPAAGRPARRPVRPAAAVPHRSRALHGDVARLRAGGLPGVPGHRASPAGLRRRDRVGGRAVPGHDPLHGPRRTGEGDGDLRLRALGGRHGGGAPRRRAHRPVRLELDLPRQPARRSDRLRALACAVAG